MALLFDSVRRAVDPRTAPEGPMTLQWEFPDAEPWHLQLDNGSTAAAPGRAPEPDVELRVAFDDWVDVIAGRLDPKRAVATRRLRLKGSPRALWRARGVFSA
jgi:putative sterol carrier protein